MNFNKEKYFKYLPSKKFTLIIGAIVVLSFVIFIVFFMSSGGQLFSSGNKNTASILKVENPTLSNLVQDDTDGDGVANWEEALWGTDKNKKMTFGDMPDATYIENKKNDLKTQQDINEIGTTETDKFAKDFFSSYSALKSSGQVDATTINNFSNTLGQKIVTPDLVDQYLDKDIITYDIDNLVFKQKYYEGMKSLFKSYQDAGIGEEIDIISQGLASSSPDNVEQYSKLSTIAKAYQGFAKKAMQLYVPQSLKGYHLRIVNSSNNTGISVSNLGKIAGDPLVGLSGLSQYQKYSTELTNAVTELETYLLKQQQN